MSDMKTLREQLVNIAKFNSALALLGWDEEVNMPPKAVSSRGAVNSLLAAEVHRKITDAKFIDLLKKLAEPANLERLSADDQVIVRETWRDVQQAQKLPVKFVEDFAQLTSEAFAAWAEARKKSDYSIFKPYLQKIVDASIQKADYYGFKQSPYDALLDDYEPAMTSAQLKTILMPLAEELKGLIKSLDTSKHKELPSMQYELEKQKRLNSEIAVALGYDLQAGRIDASPHPFTVNFHPTDVRVTTRYDEKNFWDSLGSIIHEVGHALYEQGLPEDQFGTPLADAVSLGIHESQSRIWENFVGRSQAFSSYLYPRLEKYFNKLPYSQEELYLWLNSVKPHFIRVESDEVTYNLHIVLRFELELALVEGKIKVDDLPAAWNEKMDDYLGLKVPSDNLGALQDIHWSHGSIGYFPTYSLGNIYAAQLYNKVSQEIPNLDSHFAKGDFKAFLGWLRQNIHRHGRRYQSAELIENITGEGLNSKYLIEHLKSKVELNKK